MKGTCIQWVIFIGSPAKKRATGFRHVFAAYQNRTTGSLFLVAGFQNPGTWFRNAVAGLKHRTPALLLGVKTMQQSFNTMLQGFKTIQGFDNLLQGFETLLRGFTPLQQGFETLPKPCNMVSNTSCGVTKPCGGVSRLCNRASDSDPCNRSRKRVAGFLGFQNQTIELRSTVFVNVCVFAEFRCHESSHYWRWWNSDRWSCQPES